MSLIEQTPFQKFLAGLEKQFRRFSFPNQLAFAASCCERALPNYLVFSQLQHWGDANVLRSALDEAWEIANGNREEIPSVSELEDRCRAVTPNSEAFPTTDVTAAQEAAFMVTLLLQFCRERTPSYAVRIATFARDTIDLYVQTLEGLDPADPKLEEKIASHPLMSTELEAQESDLNLVALIRSSDEMHAFMARSKAIQESNIGVPR